MTDALTATIVTPDGQAEAELVLIEWDEQSVTFALDDGSMVVFDRSQFDATVSETHRVAA